LARNDEANWTVSLLFLRANLGIYSIVARAIRGREIIARPSACRAQIVAAAQVQNRLAPGVSAMGTLHSVDRQ
jgi:hypothetical protein